MRCGACPQRGASTRVDDRSTTDAGPAVVGLQPTADVAHLGAQVIFAVDVQLHEHQHPVCALAVLQPVRSCLIESLIGSRIASSGEADSGRSAGRFQPRRVNCSATIRPLLFSHSLKRGISATSQRSVDGSQNDGPVNAASVPVSSSSSASRCSGCSRRGG